MTPRRLEPSILHVRLREIRRLLDDLDELGEVTAERLRRERVIRHAVERILIALVDLAVSINSHVAAARLDRAPLEYAESFRAAAEAGVIPDDLAGDLAPSAGLRNVLVHQYVEVDPARVAGSATLARSLYRRYVTATAAFINSVSNGDEGLD